MNPRAQRTVLGILIGLIGSAIGFSIYALAFTKVNGVSFELFWRNWVVDTDALRTELITATALPDIILFFIFYRTKREALATGVLIAVMLTVISAVIYFL